MDWKTQLRILFGLGLTVLLVLLRLDAYRFGAAEYDDESNSGGWRGAGRRLAWYGDRRRPGAGHLVRLPDAGHDAPPQHRHEPRRDAHPGPRLRRHRDAASRSLYAWLRYRRLRWPEYRHYPGAAANAIGTAFIDEACFRGAILGITLALGWPTDLAIAFQAVLYGITTRLGAPGRSRGMLLIALGTGVVGWLPDGLDGRHRGLVRGPLDHPLRDLRHDRPRRARQAARPGAGGGLRRQPAAGGLGGRRGGRRLSLALPSRREHETPSWRRARRLPVAGHRRTPRAGRRRARPPVGLYLHVPFCVSLCPYCDFVVYTGRTTRGPTARVRAFVEAVKVELDLRADALDADFGSHGPAWRPALGSVYLGGGTPSLLPAADVAALLERLERRYGLEADAEVTIEANPGPDERGDLAGFRAAGVTRVSFGAQSLDAAELRRLGRRHRPRRRRRSRRGCAPCRHRASIGRPPIRHPGPVDDELAGHGRSGRSTCPSTTSPPTP